MKGPTVLATCTSNGLTPAVRITVVVSSILQFTPETSQLRVGDFSCPGSRRLAGMLLYEGVPICPDMFPQYIWCSEGEEPHTAATSVAIICGPVPVISGAMGSGNLWYGGAKSDSRWVPSSPGTREGMDAGSGPQIWVLASQEDRTATGR